MSKMHQINKLYSDRQNGLVQREDYWADFKDILEELSEFAKFQGTKDTGLIFSGGEVLVDIKCTKTHTSRIKMILNPSDIRSVPFSVLADGFYEPFQSDVLLALGKVSKHFLDIGSNMGFYSLALATENPLLEVDAYEPQPIVFDTLRRNVEINKLVNRVTLHNAGLGDKPNILTMYVPNFTGSGGASFKNLHEDEGNPTELTVNVEVLDQSISGFVDLMKIDVEGFELNVLKGSNELIRRSTPTIMVELLRKWMKPFGQTPQMFLDEMFQAQYRCFAIRKNDLIEIQSVDGNTIETNFIFVHPSNEVHLGTVLSHVI